MICQGGVEGEEEEVGRWSRRILVTNLFVERDLGTNSQSKTPWIVFYNSKTMSYLRVVYEYVVRSTTYDPYISSFLIVILLIPRQRVRDRSPMSVQKISTISVYVLYIVYCLSLLKVFSSYLPLDQGKMMYTEWSKGSW